MKKILVAFDGSLYSESALKYAVSLSANEPGNLITGIFIEDLSYAYMFANFGIDPTGYELSGEYGEYIDEIRQSEEETIQKSRQAFVDRCEKAGVNYTTHLDEGATAFELIRESIFADLLIIGYQTYFSNLVDNTDQKALKDLLTDAKCPVLIVPENEKPIDNVIFTYNGKDNSVYAIRHYTYLLASSVNNKVNYYLLNIRDHKDENLPNEDLITEYLHLHYPGITYEMLEGKPDDKIQEYGEKKSNALLVLGSFGRNALSRLFASSIGEGLLRAKTTPVFIAHR